MPESARAYNLRGLILNAMGKANQAVQSYREAIRLDPDFEEAKANLADAELAVFSNQRKNGSRATALITILLIGSYLFAITGCAVGLYAISQPFLVAKRTVVFEPDRSRISTVTPDDLKKTASILTQRWRTLGFGYPLASFAVSDNGQIIGQVPANLDAEFINRTKVLGLVEFVDFGEDLFASGMTMNTDLGSEYFPKTAGVSRHTIMTNSELQSVLIEKNSSGEYDITFSLTEKGRKIFAAFTSRHIHSYLGIVVDKVVVSSPRINSAILDGTGLITGHFTKDAAQALAALMQSVPLPVPLK